MLARLLRDTNIRSTRRELLIGAVASAGGLVVGYHMVGAPANAADPVAEAPTPNPFAGYVRIGADNRVTVLSAHFEMGQGTYNGIATLVAEELDAAWDQMDVEGGSGNPALYGNLAWGGAIQGTGGSTAMASSFDRYRKAGAAARALLVAAASEEWGVPADEISVEDGIVSHPSGASATFGELVERASAQTIRGEPTLKPRSDWRLIGNEALPRYDSRPKVTGQQDFTIDIKLPGMLTAVMIHPPRFGASLVSFNAADALAMPGVVDVVETPRGVAVVGEHYWAALRARDRVVTEWDETGAETRSSDALLEEYRALAVEPGQAVARDEGDVEQALGSSETVLEANFEFPYLAHAALEPLNAVARRNEDGTLEVWGGHQMPDLYQNVAAEIAGVAPDQVRLHVMKSGGSFGRRAVTDADVIVEAVSIAKALGWRAPVKVQWSREDDMRAGRFRPMYVHRLRAALNADGNVRAWHNHIVGQSILRGTPFEGFLVTNGVDLTSVEGASNLPYAIPNLRVDLTTTDVGVPVLWWRAVGSTHTAFAVEAFMDEIAEAVGRDPVDLRLSLLDGHPRHAAVLRLAAEQAGWGEPLPEGRFRGVALAESFNSYVAQVAEISLDDAGRIRVQRVVCAVDCGTPINPDQIRAQMEGGIGFGLGAILRSEITLTDGLVDQDNFHTYEVLRIEEMPHVEVHIVPSEEAPTGVGEPGVPPIGPAVANAVYAATRTRYRSLPLTRHGAV